MTCVARQLQYIQSINQSKTVVVVVVLLLLLLYNHNNTNSNYTPFGLLHLSCRGPGYCMGTRAHRPSLPSLRQTFTSPLIRFNWCHDCAALPSLAAEPRLPLPKMFLPPRPLAPAPALGPTIALAPKAGKGIVPCIANCYLWCAKYVLVTGLFLGMLLSISHTALDIPGP